MDTPDLRELLAKATQLAEVGDFTHAVEPLQQVLAHDETNVDALLQFGRCLAMLGRVDEAVKALEKLAKLQPEDVEVFNILGHVLLNARQPDLATAAFNRCLELNPNHVEAMRHLANWNNFRGNPKKSLQLFEKAQALAPDHCDLLFEFAWTVFHSAGDTDRAANLFQRALTLEDIAADRGSVALQLLNYASNQKNETIAKLHREWGEKHADPLGQTADFKTHDFNTDRPLRI